MRDAATAAAMSDPDRNRWFRRRWVELPGAAVPAIESEPLIEGEPLPVLDELAATGLALLHEWRRQHRSAMGLR